MKKAKSILSLLLALLMAVCCIATASAAENEEAEDNGSFETATAFTVGGKIEGALATADDEDYYSFKTSSAGLVTVTLAHEAVSGADDSVTYFEVTVLNSSNAVVASFSSAGSSASDSSSAFSVGADQTYYVKVAAGTVHSGSLSYSVSASINKDVLSETEPNNAATAANALELSTSGNAKNYYGALSENDVDYFAIKLTSAGVVNLYLYNDDANGGNYTATLQTYVEGASGAQELADIASIAIAGTEATKVSPSIGLAAGDYLVKITGDIGSYRTRVLFRTASNVETEINDSLLSANTIKLGQTYKAVIDAKDDIDCFKFTVPAGNKGYDITFKATNAAQWTVKVLNSDNEAVAEELKVTATADKKDAKAETLSLAAGTYYIQVTAGEALDTDIYEIKVAEKAEALDDGSEDNKSLIDRIKELNWGALAENLSGWFEFIDFGSIVKSMTASIVTVITYISSML